MNAIIAVERLLTGKYEDDLNTVMATYSLIFKSRPSLVRHLENLSDLCGEERKREREKEREREREGEREREREI
jgi:hypothetical protein